MDSQTTNQVKCGSCLKFRDRVRFSATALTKYDTAVAQSKRNRTSATHVRLPFCSICNPTKTYELKCAMCGISKHVDAFSGQQRKRRDDRECKDCVQERVDREPVFQDEVREIEIMDELRHGTGSTSYLSAAASLIASSNMSRLHTDHQSAPTSIREGITRTSGAASMASAQGDSAGYPDISQQMCALSIQSPRTGNANSNTNTCSTNTVWNLPVPTNTYRQRTMVSTTSGGSNETNSRFARQGAPKQDVYEKAMIQLERQKRREEEEAEKGKYATDSDEGTDDSDDEDPY